MLERGHYFAPALYEAGFVSAAHSDEDIDRTIEAAREVFRHCKSLPAQQALQTMSAGLFSLLAADCRLRRLQPQRLGVSQPRHGRLPRSRFCQQ